MAEKEMEYKVDHFNRLTETCFAKCIEKRILPTGKRRQASMSSRLMMDSSLSRRVRKCRFRSRLIIFASVLGLCLFLFTLNSNLPQPKQASNWSSIEEAQTHLGPLSEAMVSMLPDDLAFTIFVPSEEALEDALGLTAEPKPNGNDTFVVLSRLMGFSAVPRHLPSRLVQSWVDEEVVTHDSISGYTLRIWRSSSDGGSTTLVVNNIRAKQVDVRRGEIIVHVMDGIIMNPEFAQSILLN